MNPKVKSLINHPLLKKSLIYTVGDAINKAIPFLMLPFLTNFLTPSEYGIVSNYTIYIAVLVIFVGLNANGALASNFYKMSKREVSVYIFNLFLLLLITTIFFFIVSLIVLQLISKSISVTPFFVLFAVILASCQCLSTINLDLWRMEENPIQFGAYQISQTIINVLLTVLLVIVYRFGWRGRLWAISGTSVLFALISFFILYKRQYFKVAINWEYIKDAMKFGIPLIPHTLGIWARTGIDRIFITRFYGTADAGLYSTGFQFGLLLSFIVMAFHNAYIPHLYKSLTTGGEAIKPKLVKFTYIYFFSILVVAVLLSLTSVFIINSFLSIHYKHAATYVWWAVMTQAFQGMYLMVSIYLFYAKRTVALAVTTFVVSAFQAILSYFLIKHYGPIGGAYSAFAMGLINFLALWVVSARTFPMPWLKFKK